MTKRTITSLSVIIMVWLALALVVASIAVADTKFGMSQSGSTLAEQDKKFGRIDVVRVFNDGAPKSWDKMPNRSSVVSFKIPARSVVEGEWDGFLRNWFRTAPRNYPVWWSYWHEPFDNFTGTAAQRLYKQAWQHIVRIERANAPRNLRSTFITTLFSARQGKFELHYPGDKWIDVIGWDGKLHTWDKKYIPAKEFYREAVRVSKRHDKPWGLAEYGSVVFRDNYKGRAKWMKETAHWLQNSNARFATWWPTKFGRPGAIQDHRLNDKPSIDAMRWMLRGAWQ